MSGNEPPFLCVNLKKIVNLADFLKCKIYHLIIIFKMNYYYYFF